MQRLVGLVQEFVEAADRCVARVLGHPGLHLAVDRQVGLVGLAVGLVAQRADQHAAEGVQVQPGEDVRVPHGKLHDRARLARAAREMPGALLLVLGLPAVREIAVEVVQVVAQEVRVRNPLPVEIDDMPFRVQLVERTRVLGQAGHHDRRAQSHAVCAAQFHELAQRVLLAHVAHEAVAVDVRRFPVGVRAVHAVVHWAGAHVAAGLEDRLGAVGRHARHHVEQRVADRLRHVRGQRLAAGLVASEMDGDHVLRDRQRHAGAADLGGVHVAVDPDRGPVLLRVAPYRQQRDVAPLSALPEHRQRDEFGVGAGPGGELCVEFGVIKVSGAKHGCLCSGSGPLNCNRRASPHGISK